VIILVYDDYAHHPTEVRKTLQGNKRRFCSKNSRCVPATFIYQNKNVL